MKQSARNIAEARADNTAGISSIRRQGGDGDVIFADVWPTITSVGARRAEPEPEEGWRVRVAPPRDTRVAPLGSTQVAASERVRVAPPGSVRAAQYSERPRKIDFTRRKIHNDFRRTTGK